MTEDQLFALVGRLYAAVTSRDNEIKRLTALIAEYEARAQGSEKDTDADAA